MPHSSCKTFEYGSSFLSTKTFYYKVALLMAELWCGVFVCTLSIGSYIC